MSFCHPSFEGRIGVARADVTPPVGIYARNWGAARHDRAEAIHRSLTLTALVITAAEGESKLVLVEGDLSWWRELATWYDFRDRLLQAVALSSDSLIFAVSHTHAAPPLMRPEPGLPGGEMLSEWLESILSTAIELIRTADQHGVQARLEWHRGSCRLAQPRDLLVSSGSSHRFACGFNPHDQADDALWVGRVTDEGGTTRAVLVNYACHPTTLAFDNRAISPDFVGAMRSVIEQHVSPAVAVFLQGASGDLAPRYQYVGDPAVADRHGRQLAYAVLATLADMEPPSTRLTFRGTVESGAPLALWEHEPCRASTVVQAICSPIAIPIKNWPSVVELESQIARCRDRTNQERLRRQLAIRRTLGNAVEFQLPVSIWRTGDIVWMGSMAESYSVLQQSLREKFPHLAVVCMNLINGSIGYLPPADLYHHDLYQVWQTPFARGALETVIDQSAREIERLIREE